MEVKQGATFLLALDVEVDGQAQDLTNWTVTAGIGLSNGTFYQVLQVTKVDAAQGKLELSASTDSWPIGQLFFDIKYVTDSSQIIMTESVEVLVTKGMTK